MKASRITELARVLLDMTDAVSEADQQKALADFAAYLDKKGLIKKAPLIIEEYQKLYNKKHEIVEATVTLTSRLGDTDKNNLIETLKRKYHAKGAEIEERVDQRLLGGMKIRVGDEVFDSTLKNSLNQLQAQLLK